MGERHHGCSTSEFILAIEKGDTKIVLLCRKMVGKKKVIHTDLCMTKYITYISTNKGEFESILKIMELMQTTKVNVQS